MIGVPYPQTPREIVEFVIDPFRPPLILEREDCGHYLLDVIVDEGERSQCPRCWSEARREGDAHERLAWHFIFDAPVLLLARVSCYRCVGEEGAYSCGLKFMPGVPGLKEGTTYTDAVRRLFLNLYLDPDIGHQEEDVAALFLYNKYGIRVYSDFIDDTLRMKDLLLVPVDPYNDPLLKLPRWNHMIARYAECMSA